MSSVFSFFMIVIIALVVITVLRMGSRPKEENVVQRWGAYLPGKKEAGEEYLEMAEKEFANRNTDLRHERIFFKLASKEGPALRIIHSPTYSSYIAYDTTGDDLFLHYVLYRRGDFLYEIPWVGWLFFRLFHNVFVHDHNKLIGFASMTIDCAKEAAGDLMDKFNMDRSKGIRPSSGKLGAL